MTGKLIALLFAQMLLATIPAQASPAGTQAEQALTRFQLQKLDRNTPPCELAACRRIWASAALALGDAGAYARRMNGKGMDEYLKSIGGSLPAEAKQALLQIPSSSPHSFSAPISIPFKSLPSTVDVNEPDSSTKVPKPIISVRINGIPTELILDSGAGLTIPASTASAINLAPLPSVAYSTAGLGNQAVEGIAVVNQLEIAGAVINNMFAKINHAPSYDRGVVGYDFLLRFRSAMFDYRDGHVELSMPRQGKWTCTEMKMVLAKDKLIAGIGARISIGGQVLTARIDTGADLGILVHRRQIVDQATLKPLAGKWLIDGSGKASAIEYAPVDVQIGSATISHTAYVAEMAHPDFDITLGSDFFAGRRFMFDFAKQEFCLDSRNEIDL